MKVKSQKKKDGFESIELTIIIETEHELEKLYELVSGPKYFPEIERHLNHYI